MNRSNTKSCFFWGRDFLISSLVIAGSITTWLFKVATLDILIAVPKLGVPKNPQVCSFLLRNVFCQTIFSVHNSHALVSMGSHIIHHNPPQHRWQPRCFPSSGFNVPCGVDVEVEAAGAAGPSNIGRGLA